MMTGVSCVQNSRMLQPIGSVQFIPTTLTLFSFFLAPPVLPPVSPTSPYSPLHITANHQHHQIVVNTHNCLHMPQGLAGGLISVATAMARNFLMPLVTAVPKATRSAHVPTGYAAFSTFAPGT